ncbi:hypothetical protein BGZ82_006730 [Podila clonocystis]|nr:hypothetical protein BGZ82_006730 [Podila clonocystis]
METDQHPSMQQQGLEGLEQLIKANPCVRAVSICNLETDTAEEKTHESMNQGVKFLKQLLAVRLELFQASPIIKEKILCMRCLPASKRHASRGLSQPGALGECGTFWPGQAGDRERKPFSAMEDMVLPMVLLFHEDLELFLPVPMPIHGLNMILARFGERLCRARVNWHQLDYKRASLFLQNLDLDKAPAIGKVYLETPYAGKHVL